MTAAVDHYGEAERELKTADRARADSATGRADTDRQWQHIARAAIHSLLALVDALDDAGVRKEGT